ncbi:MAG: ABC transporter ATP-binding protein [Beijerinckiaceae bacterium]|nr:ABC transporter ATP-binding protein [Beijerinckiaceae bacterium]MCZ8300355.1 ABC transporter ATP-binding protein [Beijerinckiaceae bacterium]
MADRTILEISDLNVHYGQAHALQGVSLAFGLAPVAIVGRNGMGKTTLCQAIVGLTKASAGSIRMEGQEVSRLPSYKIARHGIAIVPQGRRTFPSLTVDEHLRLASTGKGGAWTLARVYETFPRLAERKGNGGTQLSGGEQQMLAIARALLANPRYVIMDEPSEGLAPVIVDHLIDVLRALSKDGIGLLLVEQKLALATAVCDRVEIMLNGRIAASTTAAVLMADLPMQQRYLGVASAGH